MHYIHTGLLLLLLHNAAQSQFFAFGNYSHHFMRMPTLQAITDEFNTRENHTLAPIKALNGYRFGFGHYSRWTMIELSFGNSTRTKKSYNPSQLKETAEVSTNFGSVQFNLGIRPFARQYFVAGIGLNLAQMRARYSFGGDYTVPVKTYTIVPEIFIDYGIKIRFLAKRDQRDKIFYLLRLRPFYQFHLFPTNLEQMQAQLNNDANAANEKWEDNWGNFGFQVGIAVPFGPNVEELAKKQKAPKKEKTEKTPKESKGGRD